MADTTGLNLGLETIIDGVHSFRTPEGRVFIERRDEEGHKRVIPIDWARAHLRRAYITRWQDTNGGISVPSNTLLDAAQDVLEARAHETEPERVFNRVGHDEEGNIYLDLGGKVVQITPQGWEVFPNAPVHFHRPGGFQPLPTPKRGGNIDQLREFVNVYDEDFQLLVGWLLGTLHPHGPYPILALHGERGSAKSTTTRFVRNLVDASSAPTRDMPGDARNFAIASLNAWVMSLDNISGMSRQQSDMLCRLSTGAGFTTRALHTNTDEVVISVARPIVLNGISELAQHGDLLDRSIILKLPVIRDNRREEEEMDAQFEEEAPYILGALLDAAHAALRNKATTKLAENVRMADFARWVTAAEPELNWEPGSFQKVYVSNRTQAQQLEVEASPLATAIMGFVDDEGGRWTGTANQLLEALNARTTPDVQRAREWPKAFTKMRDALVRVQPALRAEGYEFVDEQRTNKARPMTFTGPTKAPAVEDIGDDGRQPSNSKHAKLSRVSQHNPGI